MCCIWYLRSWRQPSTNFIVHFVKSHFSIFFWVKSWNKVYIWFTYDIKRVLNYCASAQYINQFFVLSNNGTISHKFMIYSFFNPINIIITLYFHQQFSFSNYKHRYNAGRNKIYLWVDKNTYKRRSYTVLYKIRYILHNIHPISGHVDNVLSWRYKAT